MQVHAQVTNWNGFHLILVPRFAAKHPHVLIPVGTGIVLANSREEKVSLPGGGTVASTELCVLFVFVGDVDEVQDLPHLQALVPTVRGRCGDRVIAESPALPGPTVDGNTTCDEDGAPVVVVQKVAAISQLKGNHLHRLQHVIRILCWRMVTYIKNSNFVLNYIVTNNIKCNIYGKMLTSCDVCYIVC